MDIVKRNYTTVNNWFKTVGSLCGFNIRVKLTVYKTLSFENKYCFEVVPNSELIPNSKDIVAHFGEYFIYYVKTDKYNETGTPCLNLLICKNRPDEKNWIECVK